VLLLIAVALFAAGGAISLLRRWREEERLRIAAKASMYGGLTAAIGVIVWHSLARGQWQPMRDNFESLIWLGVLLAAFVAYVQRVKPIRGLDWFVMPVVIVLLGAAAFFGTSEFHEYQTLGRDTWIWVHRVTAYGGAAAFAVAAPVGAMYVIASRRLRSKKGGPAFASLERLERVMMGAVTLGFALLTVGLVTGIGRMVESRPPVAKVLLTSMAWLVYAVVMHAPINPRFRGRKAAALSVLGFVFVIGTIVAVQLVPG
jgi:ABC-type uncharacterized transport system permease subunit